MFKRFYFDVETIQSGLLTY